MNPVTKSNIQLHIAVFLFGAAGLFGKILFIHPLMIVLGRVVFATLSLYLILRIQKGKIKLEKNIHYLDFMFLGILLAFHWFSFFKSIQLSTIGIGLLTYSTFPLFTVILEPLFFKDKLDKANLLLTILAMVGVFILVPEVDISNDVTLGVIWGIMSGLSFSILSILNKFYIKKYSGLIIAFYQDMYASIFLLPFLIIIPFDFSWATLAFLFLLGTVFTALSHSLYINSLKNIKAQVASLVATLEPVYGILLGFFILNEIPNNRTIIGSVFILFAILILSLKKRKSENRST